MNRERARLHLFSKTDHSFVRFLSHFVCAKTRSFPVACAATSRVAQFSASSSSTSPCTYPHSTRASLKPPYARSSDVRRWKPVLVRGALILCLLATVVAKQTFRIENHYRPTYTTSEPSNATLFYPCGRRWNFHSEFMRFDCLILCSFLLSIWWMFIFSCIRIAMTFIDQSIRFQRNSADGISSLPAFLFRPLLSFGHNRIALI